MSIKSWLGVSLVANAALIGFIALHHDQPDVASVGVTEPSSEAIPIPAQVRDASEHEKMLALSTLEADARAANPPPRPEFWRSDADAQTEAYRQKVEQQQDAMRRTLIAKYGAAAAEDPLFARLFRPLDARFAYLGSNSQIALAKLQRARASATAASGSKARVSTEPAKAMDREREFNRSVQAALTDSEFDAYRLRESTSARQLRGSGVIANEQEFRAAVDLLESMESGRAPGGYLEVQLGLSKLLGQERFVRFLASRDPAFQTVRSVALAQQVQESQVLGVYEAIVAAQLEVLDAQSRAGADRAQAAMMIRDIITSRDAHIASLVGDAPAREILNAYSKNLMSANPRREVAAL